MRRNRHFRLLWSCKGGKRAVLMPSGRYATGPGGAGQRCLEYPMVHGGVPCHCLHRPCNAMN